MNTPPVARKTALLLSAILLFTASAFAQEKFRLTGSVIDAETGKGIGYATVALKGADSTVIAAWACDPGGKFDQTVKKGGTLVLVASYLGYTPQQRQITIDKPRMELEPIVLSAGVEISGVVVTTTRPLVRDEGEKIAYSVDADPETPTSTVLDILRKVPLVSVDAEDNVQLQGQSNFKVLVNGKSSSLMDKNFKEAVRGMPASAVKDIEVITNPSSKYEAEGVGGIINIVTDRRRTAGYNGSVGLRADSWGGVGGNGYLNSQIGKFTLSTNVNIGQYKNPAGESESYQENFVNPESRYTRTNGSSKNDGNYYNYQVEASYEIDTFNLVTLSVWGYGGQYKSKGQTGTEVLSDAGATTQDFTNATQSKGHYGGLSGNIDYQRTFMKPDRTLTASYKLENSPGSNEYESNVSGTMNYGQRSKNETWSREHTFQLDYVDPLTKMHTIEAGTKFILRQNGNDPQTYNRLTADQDWVYDPTRINKLDYDQYIWGLYATYALKYKKLTGKAGARLETTWNDGTFTYFEGGSHLDNNLLNVIPYVNLSWAPKTGKRVNLAYTQRLSRPGIWYLNPYVDKSNPLSWRSGNPDLKSEISHRFSATYGSYGSKWSYNLRGGVSLNDNAITSVSSILENEEDRGVEFTTYENAGRYNSADVNFYISYRPSGKFSINSSMSASYVDMSGAYGSNSGFNYRANANMMVGVWKDASANVSGYWNSPRVQLQGESSGYYYYGVSLTQRLLKKKLSLQVSANYPFTDQRNYWRENSTPQYYQRSNFYSKTRNFRFGVTYNFGKTQIEVKKAKRGISNDDVKAGEGGGGSSDGGGGGQ